MTARGWSSAPSSALASRWKQLVEMGMEEGLREAVGQMDALLAS